MGESMSAGLDHIGPLCREVMIAKVHDLQWLCLVFGLKFAKKGSFIAAICVRLKDVSEPAAFRRPRILHRSTKQLGKLRLT